MLNLPKKLYIFFTRYKLFIFVAIFLVSLIIAAIWGLSSLDPYPRKISLSNVPVAMLMGFIQAVIFITGYSFFLRGGLAKLKIKHVKSKHVSTKFSDVIGIDESKEEAMEVVNLIKDHKRVKNIGGKIIKGLLFLGPPGTGKTLLAKAIANESKTPFISIAGSEFVEMFVGVGASRIRKLFKEARMQAYEHGACIIFIDEIDVIGRGRQFSAFGGGGETNSTQNQLLVEMDGLQKKSEHIIVIGATNAAENTLDSALLRPGRFDRKIYISYPFAEGRAELFKFYLDKIKYDPSIDCAILGHKAVYKSPADIENIVKEAALIATREKRDVVEHKDVSAAMERIDLGVKQKRKPAPKEKRKTAYHEVGHLLAIFFLHPTDEAFKISVASRKNTLGVVHSQPKEEIFSDTSDLYKAGIKTCLGGYVAEKIKYGVTSEGVSSDFKKAMLLATRMVWQFGMGESGFIGDYTAIEPYQISEETTHKLNLDTENILKECYNDVKNMLVKESALMEKFVEELMEKDELEYNEINAIFAEAGKVKDKIKEELIISQEQVSLDDIISPEEIDDKH